MSNEQAHSMRERARTAITIAAGGLLVIGLIEVDHLLGEAHLPHLGIEGIIGATPPVGTAHELSDQTHAYKADVFCPDFVDTLVGVNDHSRDLLVSGFKVDKDYPVRFDVCAAAGIALAGTKYTNASNEVTKLVVSATNYVPTNTEIDFDNGVICMGLTSEATTAEIKTAERTVKKDEKNHQTIHCNWEQGTTGLGIVTDQVPATDTFASLKFAQDAAQLTPLPEKVYKQIEKDAKKEITDYLQGQYPKAEIEVKAIKDETPEQQIKREWLQVGSELKKTMQSYSFVSDNGKTEMKFTTIFDGAQGNVVLPVNFNAANIAGLNHYIHTYPKAPEKPKHQTKTPPTVDTAKPTN